MLLPQYASAAKKPNREAGVNPAQSRYCEGEFAAIEPLSKKLEKERLNKEPKPGDLPIFNIQISLRCTSGYTVN